MIHGAGYFLEECKFLKDFVAKYLGKMTHINNTKWYNSGCEGELNNRKEKIPGPDQDTLWSASAAHTGHT